MLGQDRAVLLQDPDPRGNKLERIAATVDTPSLYGHWRKEEVVHVAPGFDSALAIGVAYVVYELSGGYQ